MATIQKRFLAKNGVDNNSKTITNVADPVSSQDVATKAYVDSKSTGLTLQSTNANGVVYLNSSSQATTSGSFIYDGSAVTIAGNLTISGANRRITGDFTGGATQASRLSFQTSVTNGNTAIVAITNGTGTVSNFTAFNSSDPDNSGYITLFVNPTYAILSADKTGTGSYLPLLFGAGGTERIRITTAGNVGIGTDNPGDKLQVSGGNISVLGNTASTYTGIINQNNGASGSAYRGIFYDVRNENGAAVANFLCDVNIDGSSTLSWSTQPAGTRTDRRVTSMWLSGAGNLSIGTSNSGGFKLGVAGGSTLLGFTTDNAASYSYSNGAYYAGSSTANSLILVTNNTGQLYLDSNGNLSIGTSSIISKVTINGEMAFTSTGKSIYHYYYSGTNYAYVSTTGGGDITWVTGTYAPTERMRLSADSGQLNLYTGDLFTTRSRDGGGVHNIAHNSSATANSYAGTLLWNNNGFSGNYGALLYYSSNSSIPNELRLYNGAFSDISFFTSGTLRASINGFGAFFNPFAYNYNYDGSSKLAFVRSDGLLCTSSSTRRLKTDIQTLDDASFIMNLRPVKFKWKKKINGVYVDIPRDNKNDYGFIAEEVAEVDERLAVYEKIMDADGNVIIQPEGLDHLQFLSPIVRFIQQLKNEVDELRSELNTLRGIS